MLEKRKKKKYWQKGLKIFNFEKLNLLWNLSGITLLRYRSWIIEVMKQTNPLLKKVLES